MPAPSLAPIVPNMKNRFAQFANRLRTTADLEARRWLPRIAQFALPNLCALCGNMSQKVICAGCDEAYWNESRLRCTACGIPLPAARTVRRQQRARSTPYRCADCMAAPPPFDATFALADYRPPLDTLARGLKFSARLALAGEFARRLARIANDTLEPAEWPDVITAVPLSRKRLVTRGYNQAWEMAKPLAKLLDVRSDARLVARVAHTAPQSQLDLEARRHNLQHAFALAKSVEGLHVGVVDDVMTSGATLEAVARLLKDAGARRVTNFVALRTPKN
ncbi:phosphoribosyltransferase family protein [Paraburkholderia kururiensis]